MKFLSIVFLKIKSVSLNNDTYLLSYYQVPRRHIISFILTTTLPGGSVAHCTDEESEVQEG